MERLKTSSRWRPQLKPGARKKEPPEGARLSLTKPDGALLDSFIWKHLEIDPDIDLEEWDPPFKKGRAWFPTNQGAGVKRLIYWYQNIHKPGSKEWRPAIIVRAALVAAHETCPLVLTEADKSLIDWFVYDHLSLTEAPDNDLLDL